MGRRCDIIAVQSGLQTASGNSNAFDTSGYQEGAVILNITAKTGTFTDYRFFLQASPDGGTTWFGAATGTGLVVGSIIGAASDISTGVTWKGISQFAGPLMRLAWTLAGGTNVTFDCRACFRI